MTNEIFMYYSRNDCIKKEVMLWRDPKGERVFKLKNGLKANSFSINEKEELMDISSFMEI